MRVLITGAFGNLGLKCIEQALALDYKLRCFDLDNKTSRRRAALLGTRIEVLLGDIRDERLLNRLVEGVDAVIHNASVLPPITEDLPDMAHDINVGASEKLIRAAEVSTTKPVFIFPSSVTVYGFPRDDRCLKKAEDPVKATDNYTAYKLEVEELLRNSAIPWVILRVGVSVDSRTFYTDRKTLKNLLNVRHDNPVEYVHPKDVAYAMCKAATTDEAWHKVLLIGGGRSCQITQRDFLNTAFESLGAPLPLHAHGNNDYYTHWMDTGESQRLLGFQRHDFSSYQKEMADRLKPLRYLLLPMRPVVRKMLPWLLSLL